MAKLGILIELKDDQFKKTNHELLTLAADYSGEVYAIVFCNDVTPFQEELAGTSKIIQIPVAGKEYNPDSYAATIASLAGEFDISDLLASCTARGRDLLPRAAAKLGVGLIQDCLAIDLNSRLAVKPLYSGKILAEYENNSSVRVYTLRPNTVTGAESAVAPGKPEVLSRNLLEGSGGLKLLEVQRSSETVIDLAEAEIIVSGGRGLKSSENFNIIADLARVLGAAVGASRAAVDAEIAPPESQVGQTGKIVSPKLYIACGISGAIQHFVGMKTSKIIVAINKDPEAPIFKKADYGIVADLFEAVPVFKEELGKNL